MLSEGTSLLRRGRTLRPADAGRRVHCRSVQEFAPYQSGYNIGLSGITVTSAEKYLATLFQTFAPSQVATMLNIYSTPRQLQDAFIAALNAVVTNGSSIYNASAFMGVTLSSATQTLKGQNPPRGTVDRLNRLLLDDLLGASLSRHPLPGWIP